MKSYLFNRTCFKLTTPQALKSVSGTNTLFVGHIWVIWLFLKVWVCESNEALQDFYSVQHGSLSKMCKYNLNKSLHLIQGNIFDVRFVASSFREDTFDVPYNLNYAFTHAMHKKVELYTIFFWILTNRFSETIENS